MIGLVKERIKQPDSAKGFSCSTVSRAPSRRPMPMKNAGVNLDYVVEMDVDDAEIIKRLSGRRVHSRIRAYLSRGVQPAARPRQGRRHRRRPDPARRRQGRNRERSASRCTIADQPLVAYYSKWRQCGKPAHRNTSRSPRRLDGCHPRPIFFTVSSLSSSRWIRSSPVASSLPGRAAGLNAT